MPTNVKWLWTPEHDAIIRDMIGAGLGTPAIGARLGCSRQFALQRAKFLGVMGPRVVKGRKPRETTSKYYATPPFPRGPDPLPAGHPESWYVINKGTVLEGEPYG